MTKQEPGVAVTARRIIVVDDDAAVCDTLSSIISTATHHQVEGFTDPLAALEQARERPCHLALTDVVMPNMDGLTLLKELKTLNPQMEVIVLTAYGSIDVVAGALKNRACDFIQKPFTVDRVLEALSEALIRQEAAENTARALATSSTTREELVRRARHQLGTVVPVDRSSVARVVLRQVARTWKGHLDDLRDRAGAIERLAQSGGPIAAVGKELTELKEMIRTLGSDLESVAAQPADEPLTFEKLDVAALVRQRAQELVEYFPEIRLEVEAPAQPVVAAIAAEPFSIALFNVLINSVQAMDGKGTIRVAVVPSPGTVEVVIADSGPGFSPVALARAPQPFFSTKGRPFAGLGLTITKHVMGEHKGAVVIANGTPRGGTVTLRLPRWGSGS